jgi:hypothetical protein
VAALTYAFLLVACTRQTSSVRLSALVVLGFAAPLSMAVQDTRPQALALPLFAYMLLTLWEYRRTANEASARWGVWSLPLVVLLWANLHGSFVVGLALVWLVVAGETGKLVTRQVPALTWPALRRLVGVGLVSVAATLLNPEGWRLYVYVAGLTRHAGVRNLIEEWAPPTLNEWWGVAFFIGVAVLAAAFIYSPQKPDPTDLVVTAAFAALALQMSRSVIWFAMVGAVVLGRQLRGSLHDRPKSRRRTRRDRSTTRSSSTRPSRSRTSRRTGSCGPNLRPSTTPTASR